MSTQKIGGRDVTTFIEKNEQDGGAIFSTCELQDDGTYYCYRTWRGRGIKEADKDADPATVDAEKRSAIAEAISVYKSFGQNDIVERARKAKEFSGSLLQE